MAALRRRDLLPVLGAMGVAWPLSATAQTAVIPVIRFISSFRPFPPGHIHLKAWRDGLGEAGYVEGRNVNVEFRYAEGDYSRLPALVSELVDRPVRVFVGWGLPAALAVKAATSTIPMVFNVGVDPVAFGLVQALNHPGGNLTGGTNLFDALHQKRLQILHELAPGPASIGLLLNPKNPNASSHTEHTEAAGRVLDLKIEVLTASNADEFEPAFAAGRERGIKALLVGDDPFFGSHGAQLLALEARYAVPAMYWSRGFSAAGGLISYGASGLDISRQTGAYVGRILKGEKPGDLPVVQPTKFELVINLKTAKALGLTVPQSLLARADEIIE